MMGLVGPWMGSPGQFMDFVFFFYLINRGGHDNYLGKDHDLSRPLIQGGCKNALVNHLCPPWLLFSIVVLGKESVMMSSRRIWVGCRWKAAK
jgi:hypothetical protein